MPDFRPGRGDFLRLAAGAYKSVTGKNEVEKGVDAGDNDQKLDDGRKEGNEAGNRPAGVGAGPGADSGRRIDGTEKLKHFCLRRNNSKTGNHFDELDEPVADEDDHQTEKNAGHPLENLGDAFLIPFACLHYIGNAADKQEKKADDAGDNEGVGKDIARKGPEGFKGAVTAGNALSGSQPKVLADVRAEGELGHAYSVATRRSECQPVGSAERRMINLNFPGTLLFSAFPVTIQARMTTSKVIDFQKVLEEKKDLVWPEIKKYLRTLTAFPDYCRIPTKYQPEADLHLKISSEYPQRRGKYFRPALTLLAASAMGFPEEKAIRTAAAMQLSEEWILIHDDFEDASLARRGGKTLHRICGEELAVNAGDSLHVLMWEMLKDNRIIIGDEKSIKIMSEFCRMLKRTTLGQTAEIDWTLKNRTDLADEDILFILESKTAYYTCAGPMRLGAILAGASQKQLEAIYRFGRALGHCYQIQDDLLDLTSDFGGQKKQQGNDIYEGKRTIMLAHLFRTVRGKDGVALNGIMKKKRAQKTRKEVEAVIGMMEKYGSLEYGERLIKKAQKEAKKVFGRDLGFLKFQPARNQLWAAIDFVASRDH